MSPLPIVPLFLTPKELAARWRLALSSVYRLKDSGHLPYYQIGGAVRFWRDDIEAYERQGRSEAVIRPKLLRRKRRRIRSA
jgi:excisionase family DNA binding protein